MPMTTFSSCGAFAAQCLGAFGVVPDVGAFQLPVYFFETLDFAVVVKDTP